MKKIYLCLISILSILLFTSCLGNSQSGGVVKPSGGGKPEEHECKYGEWHSVYPGDCYSKGKEERTCNECGKIENRETDYNHNYQDVAAKAPTCTNDGYNKHQACVNCGDKKGFENVPATGHQNTSWVENGSYDHYEMCNDCRSLVNDSYGQHQFDDGVTTEATCTDSGKITYTCKKCGYEKYETIWSEGHQWLDADCENPETCSVCKATQGEALGHSPLISSCDKDVVCATCNKTLKTAQGHTSSGEATCTDYEYCTVCYEVLDEPSHSFSNGVCSECKELQGTEGLTFELDFDGEYYYRVTGIKKSVDYIVIPNTYNNLPVKEIDVEAFMNDSTLEKVYIPSNVNSILEKAFYNCSNLTGIYFEGTKLPKTLGSNWNNANTYFKGEYTLTGNVVELSLVDNDINRAYDAYAKLVNSLGNNYMLDYDHELDYNAGERMNVKGSIDLNVSDDTIYAYETMDSSYNVSGYSQSFVTKTKEYYNDGYLYSNVIMQDSQTINSKSYCTLPFSQVFDNNLTVDILNLTRTNIKYVTFTAEAGIETITITNTDGYTVEEFNSLINYDKIPLNMDISIIMQMPGAVGTIQVINNTNTGELKLTLSLYGSMTDSGITYVMDYTNTSIYTNVGSTPEQVCPDKSAYTLHNHTADTNTCGEVTCKSCKLIIKEATDHTFTTKDCETNTCTVCNEVVETGKKHIYQDGQCVYCGLRQATPNMEFEFGYDYSFYVLTSIGNCGSKNIVIPSTYEGLPVKQIADYAFEGAEIESVYIPSSVWYIGEYIFDKCTSLEELIIEDISKIPSTLIKAEDNNIKHITILGGVEIQNACFNGFSKLETIELADTITSIGSSAFRNCTSLVSIKLPSGISKIQSSAFENCASLKEIIIPDGVAKIDYSAFEGCTSLEKVYIPESVTWIAYDAFNDVSVKELTGSVDAIKSFNNLYLTIEKIVITGEGYIWDNAFADATNLQSVTLSDSITELGIGAFENCPNLTEVVLPASLTKLKEYSFKGCTSLETITLPASLTTIDSNAFYGCTNLKTVNAGGELKYIYSNAFEECTSLEEVIFEEYNLKNISSSAFKNCTSLKTLPIEEGLESIGENAFENCSFEEVIIPSTIESLNDAFVGCKDINKVYLSSSLVYLNSNFSDSDIKEVIVNAKVIYSEAMMNMTTIEKVVIKDTVESIDSNAFTNCSNLSEVVIEGNNLKELGFGVFKNCTALETITLPKSMNSFNNYVFDGCDNLVIYYAGTIDDWCNVELMWGEPSSPVLQVEEFYIQDSNGEYYNLRTATELVISDKVTSIGQYNLHGISGLQKLTIPGIGSDNTSGDDDKLTYYFTNGALDGLKEVTIIGTTVTPSFLQGLSSIEKVTIADTVTEIGLGALRGLSKLNSLTIPFVGKIRDSENSPHFGHIFGTSSYQNHNNSSFVPDTLKELTITSATKIGYQAFRNCITLEKINLNEGIESVDGYAFAGCEALKEITLPNTVTSIGYSAFYEAKITKVTLSNSLVSIADQAFMNCTQLTEVVLPNTVKTIGEYAFSYCLSLSKVTLSNTLESIGRFAFDNCKALESIVIPTSVITIGYQPFNYCFDLTIYCEKAETDVPATWDSSWKDFAKEVIYSYTA